MCDKYNKINFKIENQSLKEFLKYYQQNICALRELVEEFMCQLFFRVELTKYEDMNLLLERSSELSRTSKLWVDCLINPLFIMMMYVRAEPEVD